MMTLAAAHVDRGAWCCRGVQTFASNKMRKPFEYAYNGQNNTVIPAQAGIYGHDAVFKHKGLAKFFVSGSTAGIQASHAKRLQLILGRLNAAAVAKDMNLPGLRPHELAGNRRGTWSVTVSGNWRVTFRFENGDAEVMNYEDYH